MSLLNRHDEQETVTAWAAIQRPPDCTKDAFAVLTEFVAISVMEYLTPETCDLKDLIVLANHLFPVTPSKLVGEVHDVVSKARVNHIAANALRHAPIAMGCMYQLRGMPLRNVVDAWVSMQDRDTAFVFVSYEKDQLYDGSPTYHVAR